MKTKLFYGNQYVDSFVVTGNKEKKLNWFQRKVRGIKNWFKNLFKWFWLQFKRAAVATLVLGILAGIYQAGWKTGNVAAGAQVSYAQVEVVKEVQVEVKGKLPVLERIAKCESGGKHFDSNGQVLMRSNTNKTVDVGYFQINSVWFKKASEMGLDITKEADNKKMGEWIFANRGTVDWEASRSCWSK